MGRLTQAIDFININPLPSEIERENMYTHISDSDFLFSLRKIVSLNRRKKLDDSE